MARGGHAPPDEPTTIGGHAQPAPRGDVMLVVAGEGFVSTYEVEDRELTIGRSRDCDVVIDHPALSRRHARVRGSAGVVLTDLGSTNGTRVRGEVLRAGEARLAPGDSFQIGPFGFMVVARGPSRDPSSLSMRDVLRVPDPTPRGLHPLVRNVATSKASVLILGETGVGKEVLAESLHQHSGRPGPLTRLNCAALSESLLESELFGHEKGAFTGAGAARAGLLESADRGTVFLDEVGELPLTIQAKLLRAVERREVLRVGATRPIQIDVRFVAATNRDLLAEVEAGRFRRDLFFRLDGVTLVIPPLRERAAMIGGLALRFLEDARAASAAPAQLSHDALAALEAYPWPGNVRELKAVIDRAVLLARDGEILPRHLAFARSPAAPAPALATPPAPAAPSPPPAAPPGLTEAEQAERAAVIAALDACAGNQSRAAKRLGIGRTTLLQRLKKYGIPRPRG